MKNLIFIVLILSLGVSFSQDGTPDLSFGDNGIKLIDLNADENYIVDFDQNEDGKIYSVGVVSNYNQQQVDGRFIMVNLPDGTLDSSFGNNGILFTEGTFISYSQIKLLKDGKILISGKVDLESSISKLFSDGSLDSTFGNNGYIYFPSILGDHVGYINENNKIVCAGRDESYFTIKVYDLEGNPDVTFGNNGQLSFDVNKQVLWETDLHFRPNLGIFLAIVYLENSTTKYAILKYLENGNLDTSFGENGEVTIPSPSENWHSNNYLSFFDDDSILINSIISYLDMAFARIYKTNSSGVYNKSFGVIQSLITSIIIQPNQRFLVLYRESGIQGNGGRMYMKRYYENGDIDPNFFFNTNDVPEVFDVRFIIDSQGKIVVTTSEYTGRNLLVFRLNNDPLSISEFQSQNITVSPNPSSSSFVIHSKTPFENEYYQIFDITGKHIKEGFLSGEKTTIDLSRFDTGIYFLKFEDSTIKLLKN